MTGTIKKITDAEFAILDCLWQHGAKTVRGITEQLRPKPTHSTQASIDKLIQRLESKALVRRDRDSFPHMIEPLTSRKELVGQQLQAVANKLSEGSVAPLLMQMIAEKRLSKRERQQLRDLLDQSDS